MARWHHQHKALTWRPDCPPDVPRSALLLPIPVYRTTGLVPRSLNLKPRGFEGCCVYMMTSDITHRHKPVECFEVNLQFVFCHTRSYPFQVESCTAGTADCLPVGRRPRRRQFRVRASIYPRISGQRTTERAHSMIVHGIHKVEKFGTNWWTCLPPVRPSMMAAGLLVVMSSFLYRSSIMRIRRSGS